MNHVRVLIATFHILFAEFFVSELLHHIPQ